MKKPFFFQFPFQGVIRNQVREDACKQNSCAQFQIVPSWEFFLYSHLSYSKQTSKVENS